MNFSPKIANAANRQNSLKDWNPQPYFSAQELNDEKSSVAGMVAKGQKIVEVLEFPALTSHPNVEKWTFFTLWRSGK